MEILNLPTFVLSLVILWKGGHLLVKGAVGVAEASGLGSFFIGFTLVALATSAPEFLVCLIAALRNSSDIAIGNMVGSNIANIGLIFGLTALASPVAISKQAWKELRLPLLFLVLMTSAAYLLSRTGFFLKTKEGIFLFSMLAVFFFLTYKKSKEEKENPPATTGRKWAKLLFFVVSGSVLLAAGAHFLVGSAIQIAKQFGISELFIGVVAVAIGTSLPELAASIVAAFKKEQNIVVGNIIGSNFFNLAFLGLVAAIQPVEVNKQMFGKFSEFTFVLLLTGIFAVFILKTQARGKSSIGREKGAFLLAVYAAFLYFIFGSLS